MDTFKFKPLNIIAECIITPILYTLWKKIPVLFSNNNSTAKQQQQYSAAITCNFNNI